MAQRMRLTSLELTPFTIRPIREATDSSVGGLINCGLDIDAWTRDNGFLDGQSLLGVL